MVEGGALSDTFATHLTDVDAAGITRNSYKKRRATGGKQPQYKKKRQYELGRLGEQL